MNDNNVITDKRRNWIENIVSYLYYPRSEIVLVSSELRLVVRQTLR